MVQGHAKKGKSGAKRDFRRKYLSTKVRTRDIDLIQEDVEKLMAGQELKGIIDEDVAGGGHHYCVPCARHFINAKVLELHMTSKPHKKRLKLVAEEKYTQDDADRAAGKSSADTRKPTRSASAGAAAGAGAGAAAAGAGSSGMKLE